MSKKPLFIIKMAKGDRALCQCGCNTFTRQKEKKFTCSWCESKIELKCQSGMAKHHVEQVA